MTRALHESAVVADTHNDLLMLVVARPPEEWAAYFRDRWLPQLREGGVDLQVLPVYVDTTHLPERAWRQTLLMIEAAHRIAEGNADAVLLCRTGAEVRAALETGRIALVLALEGLPAIGTDVELLATAHRLGVRMASLTHLGRTALADGSEEDAANSRLTTAGMAAVGEMERLGILVDLSHLGRAGVDHVLEIASRPLLASHSSARALHEHHRNLSDEHLKAIAATGGVSCVNFLPGFLTDPHATVTVADVVDHIDHVAAVAGVEHVGLGPDFIREVMDEWFPGRDSLWMAGIDAKKTVEGLAGPAGLPLVTEELVRRGRSEDEVRAILGGNVLRLLDVGLQASAGTR